MTFLEEDVETWEETDSFHASRSKVQGINVVNDPIERAVKLTTDFVSSAKTEEHFQNILQVVEQDRKERPNLQKKKET